MMRYLTCTEVLAIHDWSIQAFGGADGVCNSGALDSAVHQPFAAFGGQDLYPTLQHKAAALAYSIIQNNAFVDGNKRTGFFAMATFAKLNGAECVCGESEGEQVVLAVAAGEMTRESFTEWVSTVIVEPNQTTLTN